MWSLVRWVFLFGWFGCFLRCLAVRFGVSVWLVGCLSGVWRFVWRFLALFVRFKLETPTYSGAVVGDWDLGPVSARAKGIPIETRQKTLFSTIRAEREMGKAVNSTCMAQAAHVNPEMYSNWGIRGKAPKREPEAS